MRASDGILRLGAPVVSVPRLKQRRSPSASTATGRSWLGRLLPRRREPTTYQRCLAIHIHFAGPHSALS